MSPHKPSSKKVKKRSHKKKKPSRFDLLLHERQTPSAAAINAPLLVTQSSLLLTSGAEAVDDATQSPARKKQKKKMNATAKKQVAITQHSNVCINDFNLLLWLRREGPPPSNPTLSSNSFKISVRNNFFPVKRNAKKVTSSSSGSHSSTGRRSSSCSLPGVAPMSSIKQDIISPDITSFSISQRRLFIQDIILLKPDGITPLVMCFNQSTPKYECLKELYDACPVQMPLLDFGKLDPMFQLHVTVTKNQIRPSLPLSRQEVLQYYTDNIRDGSLTFHSIHSDKSQCVSNVGTTLTAPVVSTTRRLFIEDIIALKPNLVTPYVICFNESAPSYNLLRELYDACLAPLPILDYGKTARFYQLRVTVKKNPKCAQIAENVIARSDFLIYFNGNGNEGLTFIAIDADEMKVKDQWFFLKWRDFYTHKLSLLLFGNVPWRRNFKQELRLLSHSNRLSLLPVLADECRFDVGLSNELCSAYEDFHQLQLNNKVKKPTVVTLDTLLGDGLVGNMLIALEKKADDVMLLAVIRCYGSFISWTDSILSDAEIDDLTDAAYKLLPRLMEAITIILGTKKQLKWVSSKHKHLYHRRRAFFALMSLARQRNNHRFIWWGVINSAIHYHSNAPALLTVTSRLFGLTCTHKTLKERTTPSCEPGAYRIRVIKALENEKVVIIAVTATGGTSVNTYIVMIIVFDNTQKNCPFKWQRFGKSSNFLKLTSRMFWKLHQGLWKHEPVPTIKVPISYVGQIIPSPMYEPAFECFNACHGIANMILRPATLKLPVGIARPPDVDATGKRVQCHMNLIYYAGTLRCVHRHLSLRQSKTYAFRSAKLQESESVALAAGHFGQNRGFGLLLRGASGFQRRVVEVYRGADRPKMQLLVFPVLKLDETTRIGMAGVILQILKDACLLVRSESTDHTSTAEWIVPKDIKLRFLLVAGDGLSHERWRSFEKNLLDMQEQGMTYVKHFRQCSEVIKALKQCVLLPGDLHASLFHTLGPIYMVFYGAFIQAFKTALGFKRIDWKKVEKSYRQSSLLAIMLLSRVEARLIETCVSEISPGDVSKNIKQGDGGEALGTFLALHFETWIQQKLDQSTDKWFRLVVNFFVQCRDYRTVRESIRNGDSLMLEAIQQRFMYIFCAVRKPKCLENSLCTQEAFYNDIPFWLLQVIRDNRTARMYNSRDKQSGQHTADRAQDETMEVVQHKYKSMDHAFTDDEFVKMSYHLGLTQQSSTFGYHHYTGRRSVDSVDELNSGNAAADSDVTDHGDRKKQSVASKRTQEKKLIDEILTLSCVMDETPGREFDANRIWNVLAKTTTDLGPPSNDENDPSNNDVPNDDSINNNEQEDTKTDNDTTNEEEEENQEEEDISKIVSVLEEFRNLIAAQSSSEKDNIEQIETIMHDANVEREIDMTIDVDDELEDDANTDGLEEMFDLNNQEPEEADSNSPGEASNDTTPEHISTESEEATEIAVGRTTQKVLKIPVNTLAFEDLHKLGKDKLVALDLPRRRLRRRQRQERERNAFHQNLFDFTESMAGNTNAAVQELQEARMYDETRNRYKLAEKLANLEL